MKSISFGWMAHFIARRILQLCLLLELVPTIREMVTHFTANQMRRWANVTQYLERRSIKHPNARIALLRESVNLLWAA